MPLQERLLLLLESAPEFDDIKDILKSPLGLVTDLVKSCFSNDPDESLLKHEGKLDDIKKKVAGIASSHMMSGTYKVAKYSPSSGIIPAACSSCSRPSKKTSS